MVLRLAKTIHKLSFGRLTPFHSQMCHCPRKHGGEGVDMQKLELALQKEVGKSFWFLIFKSNYPRWLSFGAAGSHLSKAKAPTLGTATAPESTIRRETFYRAVGREK